MRPFLLTRGTSLPVAHGRRFLFNIGGTIDRGAVDAEAEGCGGALIAPKLSKVLSEF